MQWGQTLLQFAGAGVVSGDAVGMTFVGAIGTVIAGADAGTARGAGAAFANASSTSSSMKPPTVPPLGKTALVPVTKKPASGTSATDATHRSDPL